MYVYDRRPPSLGEIMTGTDVEVVVDGEFEIGEGPLWHVDDQRVYWTDVPTGELFRYDPAADEYERFFDGGTAAGYTIQEDGTLLLFMRDGAVRRWDDGELITVIEEIPEERGKRFNDVVADPQGRVFAGTMDEDTWVGRLYRLDTDGTIHKLWDDVDLPNGMAFTPSRDALYFTESNSNTIYRFAYDEETGELGDRSIFAHRPDEEWMYDGLTVDAEGRVWSALFGGSAIVRHDENGEIDRKVEIPSKSVTSLAFCEPDFDQLYITSGTYLAGEEDAYPGGLFRYEPGVTGLEEYRSRVEV